MLLYLLCSAAFLGFCVSDDEAYSVNIHVTPSIASEQHLYYIEAFCPSIKEKGKQETESRVNENAIKEKGKQETESRVNEKLVSKGQNDFGGVILGSTACPEGFSIGIAMFNKNDEKNFTSWPSWKRPVLVEKIKFKNDQIYLLLAQHIEFGNHFKLSILPKLPKDSKIVYRVKVFCATNKDLEEFLTYTNSETPVVFNSNFKTYIQPTTLDEVPEVITVGQRCEEYIVNVWPTYKKWLKIDEQNWLSEPEIKQELVIANGATHTLKFENNFNLKIEPSLEANSGTIYFVTVKCHGPSDNSHKFKMYTLGKSTKILLNGEKKCTEFDFGVSKTKNEIVETEVREKKSGKNMAINKLLQIAKIKAKQSENGVKVKNGGSYTIKYTYNEEDEEDSSDDEDLDDDDDGDEDGDDDIDLDLDIEEMMKSGDLEDDDDEDEEGQYTGSSDSDDMEEHDEESEDDDEPIAKKIKKLEEVKKDAKEKNKRKMWNKDLGLDIEEMKKSGDLEGDDEDEESQYEPIAKKIKKLEEVKKDVKEKNKKNMWKKEF